MQSEELIDFVRNSYSSPEILYIANQTTSEIESISVDLDQENKELEINFQNGESLTLEKESLDVSIKELAQEVSTIDITSVNEDSPWGLQNILSGSEGNDKFHLNNRPELNNNKLNLLSIQSSSGSDIYLGS